MTTLNNADLVIDESQNAFDKDNKKDPTKKKKGGGFQSFNLSPFLFKAVMAKGYKVPTPIQRKAIPVALEGHNTVAMARTGSGKTAAFVIPVIEKLKGHSQIVGIRGVILSPSRELAVQTAKYFKELTKNTDLKCALIVGGHEMEREFEKLA